MVVPYGSLELCVGQRKALTLCNGAALYVRSDRAANRRFGYCAASIPARYLFNECLYRLQVLHALTIRIRGASCMALWRDADGLTVARRAGPATRPNRNKAEMPEVVKSESEWREQLGDARYQVLRQRGTERPFSGGLLEERGPGTFHCAACGYESVFVRCQIRLTLRLAKLHAPRAAAKRAAAERQHPWHAPHRSALQTVRFAPGPRLRRRPGAARYAVLHQLAFAGVQTVGFIRVADRQLEYLFIPAPQASLPVLVFLHEGLGSLGLWKSFPRELSQITGCGLLVYSRYGNGFSDTLAEPRPVLYMHEEAGSLAELLTSLNVERSVLVGHSDGASIALIFAAEHPHRVRAIVALAPHVFVEELSIAGIARAKRAYESASLRDRLTVHHADVRPHVLRLERRLAST